MTEEGVPRPQRTGEGAWSTREDVREGERVKGGEADETDGAESKASKVNALQKRGGASPKKFIERKKTKFRPK